MGPSEGVLLLGYGLLGGGGDGKRGGRWDRGAFCVR